MTAPDTQTDSQPDPLSEARRLLAEEEQARRQACAEEIHQVLAKYGFRLQITEPQIVLIPAS
jgi:MarR-like DNA-binding transcriptional regulator SgrR of sgrS sRNA